MNTPLPDPVTGLPGRSPLVERLMALPEDRAMALLCIDLDNLGALNESMGRGAGDSVLGAAARRIAAAVAPGSFVARYGGDAFAVLLEPVHSREQLDQIASGLIGSLMRPYRVGQEDVFVGASMGLACTLRSHLRVDQQGQATTPTQALRHARAALERAKLVARGGWVLYEPGMAPLLAERLHLESELAMAVQQEQFVLCYQPKASCRSGAITGFEALLRWQHPSRGMVPPAEFMPVLEATGLINQVGRWALRTACLQLAAWERMGQGPVGMAVNVSLQQLVDARFPDAVQAALVECAVAPQRLELELTERMLMQDVRHTEALLFRLKELGVRLAIDDFGTGYSSLAFLKRMPIDTVKIDKTFVQDITTNANDASITRATIRMAHSLNLAIVAEGVETPAQLSRLVTEGCDSVQGFLVGTALPADEAGALLASGWSLPAELTGRPARLPTLLLLDDEEGILSALRRLLRREGYRILCARSGAEGLDLLARNDVDVIVSDQRMPNMTGLEFLRLAKELYPDTVRMVLSGYADMQSITNAINQGAIYKFLSKPWDDQDLKDSIAEAFRRRELSQENGRLTRELAQVNQHLQQSNQALADLLQQQSRQSTLGLAALSAAQQLLHLLPAPVLGLDPDGMVVLRNEASAPLALDDAALAGLAQLPPPWPDVAAVHGTHLDGAGRRWRVAARNLADGCGQHSGSVFVFSPAEPA